MDRRACGSASPTSASARSCAGCIAAESIAFVFFALVLPIEVAFAKETLDAGDLGYGLMLASWGTGMVIGSLLFSGLRGASLASLLIGGTAAIGVALSRHGRRPDSARRLHRLRSSAARATASSGSPSSPRSRSSRPRPTRRGSSACSSRSQAGSPAWASSWAARSPRSHRRARASPWPGSASWPSWRSPSWSSAARAGRSAPKHGRSRAAGRSRVDASAWKSRGSDFWALAALSPRRPRRRGPSRPRSSPRSGAARPEAPGAAAPCRRRPPRSREGSGRRRRLLSEGLSAWKLPPDSHITIASGIAHGPKLFQLPTSSAASSSETCSSFSTSSVQSLICPSSCSTDAA